MNCLLAFKWQSVFDDDFLPGIKIKKKKENIKNDLGK